MFWRRLRISYLEILLKDCHNPEIKHKIKQKINHHKNKLQRHS